MKRFRSLEKVALALAIGSLFAACTTTRITEHEPSPVRGLASVAAKFDLDCVITGPVFRAIAPDDADGDEFEDLTAALGVNFTTLASAEKERVVALALAESFAYGQKLLGDYEALLDQGYTHERIAKRTSVYAELQSLYFMRHRIQQLALREFAGVLVGRMQADEGGGRARGQALIQETAQTHLAHLKGFIAQRTPDVEYQTLALAELDRAFNDLGAYAQTCGGSPSSTRLGFAAVAEAFDANVIAAARSLPKKPQAYVAFQSKAQQPGFDIAKLVKREAKESRSAAESSTERSPQNVAEKVIFPSTGTAGNIFGTSFPKGVWALTFDDGPHGGSVSEGSYTKRVLANLQKHKMKATFFILSQQIERKDCPGVGPRKRTAKILKYDPISRQSVSKTVIVDYDIRKDRPDTVFPELALAERDAGHAVESHSYYHSDQLKNNDAELKCEIVDSTEAFAKIVGQKPKFFRLPYGNGFNNPRVRKMIADAGFVHVYWSVDTLDWQDHDPDSIVRRTLKAMANGGQGVILFHDVHPQSVIASEKMMTFLKDPANRIETVTIPQIVDRLNGMPATSPDPKFGAP